MSYTKLGWVVRGLRTRSRAFDQDSAEIVEQAIARIHALEEALRGGQALVTSLTANSHSRKEWASQWQADVSALLHDSTDNQKETP